MADIIRLTLNNGLAQKGTCIFDYDNKKVIILREQNALQKEETIELNFSDITALEYRAPKLMVDGGFCFIVNGNRLMIQDNKGSFVANVTNMYFKKKEMPMVLDALNRFITECNLHGVNEWQSTNAPKIGYDGRFNTEERAKPVEYRIKCNVCGNIFCYNDADIRRNQELIKKAKSERRSAVLNDYGVSMVVGNQMHARADSIESQIRDFSRCPHCNSTNLTELSEEEFKAAQAPAPQPGPAENSFDEIKKYKELLDMGIITQEEFDLKKKEILGL